ncbi:hypothetical protein C8Q70DRAFT_1008897 [Cubamyces menziesii]|nr:hypothetical protein C8Q70DRAFT_1008897 [Cubamyces menziesii]
MHLHHLRLRCMFRFDLSRRLRAITDYRVLGHGAGRGTKTYFEACPESSTERAASISFPRSLCISHSSALTSSHHVVRHVPNLAMFRCKLSSPLQHHPTALNK